MSKLLLSLVIAAAALSQTACATLLADKQQRIFVYPAADDVKVTDNGAPLSMEKTKDPYAAAGNVLYEMQQRTYESCQRANESAKMAGQKEANDCKQPEAPGSDPRGDQALTAVVESTHAHNLKIERGGKTVDAKIGTSVGGGWIAANIFTTGPIGIVIDWVTGNWNHLENTRVDIDKAAAGQ